MKKMKSELKDVSVKGEKSFYTSASKNGRSFTKSPRRFQHAGNNSNQRQNNNNNNNNNNYNRKFGKRGRK